MEVTRRRGRRRRKLLYDLKDRRGYSHLKEEALDRTMWRNRFRGGFGPVVRQNTEGMNVKTNLGGTLWRSWLRHCATIRKVAGSIPDGVIGIFHWHNPSGRTMVLRSTQPLTDMSTRNISWGKGGRCRSQWPRGLRRRSTAARLLRSLVQIPPGHGCLSLVNAVCCQVEVSATSWSLVQRSPTDCGASLRVI